MELNHPGMEKSDYKRYVIAKKRVEAIKGFWQHLTIFAIVNLGIYIVRFVVLPQTGIVSKDEGFENWLDWNTYLMPLIWGIGISIHGLAVFGPNWKRLKRWEERKIREFMDEESDTLHKNN